MPLPWTAGRRELEQKKLATSTGWAYPTAKDEEEEVRVLPVLMLVQQHQTAAGYTRLVFRTSCAVTSFNSSSSSS